MQRYIWQNKSWPKLIWETDKLVLPLGECRLRQHKLLSKVFGLEVPLNDLVQAEILVEEAIKTSAIEGDRLDPLSVRSSVARRLGLPSAGMLLDRRIDDLISVLLDATQKFDKPLTQERLWGWQAALFPSGYSGNYKIKVGGWRDDEEPMRVVSGPKGGEKTHFEAPPAEQIDGEMKRLFMWFDESQGSVGGIVRAALVHLWFVTIHPFDDGNGRLARALTDMALAQDAKQPGRYFSLSSQIMTNRESYYNILEKTQSGSIDVTDWLVWFLCCFVKAMEQSENIMNMVITSQSTGGRLPRNN